MHTIEWLLKVYSAETFSVRVEALGPDRSFLIDAVGRLVAGITRHLDGVVLNHVLLDDSFTCIESTRLVNCSCIEVCLGDEAIVAWDMRSCLGGTHGQLVVLVTLCLRLDRQFVSWVMTMDTERFLELCLEVATLGSVRLARV